MKHLPVCGYLAVLLIAAGLAMCGGCGALAQMLPQVGPIGVGPFHISQAWDCNLPILPEIRFDNLSADAPDTGTPFNPQRATVVIIHGANPYAKAMGCGAYAWPDTFARAIQPAVGDAANILVCRFDGAAVGEAHTVRPRLPYVAQDLADFILASGLDHDLQLISHSAGSIVAHEVVRVLGYVEQVTFLDFAEETGASVLAEWEDFIARVGYLENYWVPGPYGTGFDLQAADNVSNVLILSNFANGSNLLVHFVPVFWYQETSRVPEAVGGFRWSLAGGTRKFAGIDFIEYQGFMFARPGDGSMSQLVDDGHPAAQGVRAAATEGRLTAETAPQVAGELGMTYIVP
ncbi:MAG: hypothetical protein JSU68_13985 [Phycisphaerales bacterium]|nr:MAG: hypothetical protein JSU68_13985 [Phycisphaerales bacterium]